MCRAHRLRTGLKRRRDLIYTGVGSRQTPDAVLQIMTLLGRTLAERNWVLRSGGSPGADVAFESGCDQADGRKEIYLPWRGFNGSDSPLFNPPAGAMEIAYRIHPGLIRRNRMVKKLRARNICQILGYSLNEPSDVVIAWTEGGERVGGTATVLQMAEERGIATMNLGEPEFASLASEVLLARVLTLAS
jgi:hypothetical protein